jgi:hypothetical protein
MYRMQVVWLEADAFPNVLGGVNDLFHIQLRWIDGYMMQLVVAEMSRVSIT